MGDILDLQIALDALEKRHINVTKMFTGVVESITLLWPGYFAAMQNELCKTTNFVQHFPIC